MAYTRQTWRDGAAGGTPLSATRLNHMEAGIADAHSLGGASALLDVDAQFGGDIAAAVKEAEASGGPSAVVMLGRGDYAVTSTVEVTRPISIRGGGARATRIKHGGTFTGPVFHIGYGGRNREWEAEETTYSRADDDSGAEFRDFCIIDDDRSIRNRAGIAVDRADDLLMDNVWFGYLTGTALKLGGDPDAPGGTNCVRESDFRRVRIYKCGSGSAIDGGGPIVPAFVLQNSDRATSGDGTNQNYFQQFRFVYNHGPWIIRNGSSTERLRRTIFTDTQLHGLYHRNLSPSYNNPFSQIVIEGDAAATYFKGLVVNGVTAGHAAIRVHASPTSGKAPRHVVVTNVHATSMAGALLDIDRCDSFVLTGEPIGVGGKVVHVAPSSGLNGFEVAVRCGPNPVGKIDIPASLASRGTATWNGKRLSLPY